jgi:energy-coupling factor transporter ATP-binding protein EcfA2
MVSKMADDMDKWFKERPKWLQTAARLLADSRRIPTDAEISTLAALCEQEAGGDKSARFMPASSELLGASSILSSLVITSIDNVVGVNALRKGAALQLGDTDLAVVYGANGTGKTGFARLLKQACGSRAREDLLGNAFTDEQVPPSAQIVILVDGKPNELAWTLADGPVSVLKHAHTFDSTTAKQYVTEENEAQYEPQTMRFVSALIRICERVNESLKAKRVGLVSKLPNLPAALVSTEGGRWIASLQRTKAARSELERRCACTEEHERERISLEAALNEKDIPGRLAEIAKERSALTNLKAWLSSLQQQLSDEEIRTVIHARNDATAKRRSASEEAKVVFAQAPLDGVGQQTWQALWRQAEMYSSTQAYPGRQFPNTEDGAKCVLCQQDLSELAADRLRHFQKFVIDGLEASAAKAESNLRNLEEKLPIIPPLDQWMIQVASLRLEDARCAMIRQSLSDRRAAVNVATQVVELPPADWQSLSKSMRERDALLAQEQLNLRALQTQEDRLRQQTRLDELRASQWMNQNKPSIADEIQRLRLVDSLADAEKLTSTNALTVKNGELAKVELEAGYRRRFAEELRALGGTRLCITPEPKRQGKGRITFGIQLENAKKSFSPRHVLSEGESRIVALAAFLADMRGREQITPFIFDDPISSLDQEFEERVVDRLTNMARSRQVIVFTHRLSLMTLLEESSKKLNGELSNSNGKQALKTKFLTLVRMGADSGIVGKLAARDQKAKAAANQLLNQEMSELKKLAGGTDAAAYTGAVRSFCTEFRILLEKCVEDVLLNDVVRRFRRPIKTLGKIGGLARIRESDCALIDRLMTQYSSSEHSQSPELPDVVPDLAALEADIRALVEWIAEFEKRPWS